MSKFSNILRMMILLKSKGKMKTKELAEILEVDERMIRKYKEDLEMAGIYVNSYAGANGGYKLDGYDYLLNLSLSEEEYSALELASMQLENINFIYYKEFVKVIEKINILRKGQVHEFNKVEYMFKETKSSSLDYERKKCLDINAAIISRQKIKIKYFSLSSGESERIVHPYAIIEYKGAIYFVGFCENRKEVISFKILRIKEYFLTDEKYEIPKEFSLKDYLKDSFGIYKGESLKIKLKINKPMSYIVSEKIWTDNQKIFWNDDESIIFEGEMEGKTEIQSWILSMGSSVTVLEPKGLAESIVNEVNNISKNYLK